MIGIENGVPLSRLTTIGTGGPARALARPRTVAELSAALRFAASDGLEVVVVGLGSNMLAADEGVDASSWRWTLTYLEHRPVVELDDGTVIRVDAVTGEAHVHAPDDADADADASDED